MNISRKLPRKVPPLLVILVGTIAVSTASIFVRFAQGEAPSIVIAAYRLALSTLLLTPYTLIIHRREYFRLNRGEIVLCLVSGVLLALHFAAWIQSLALTSVTSSVVLATTTPLWVALLSPLLLKEPLTRKALVGLLIALVGGIVIALNDACSLSNTQLICKPWGNFWGENSSLGNLLALSAALTGAGYFMIGRRIRAQLSAAAYVTIVYGTAAVCLWAMVILSGAAPFGYSPATFGWFLALAIIPQLLGHSSFNWALGYLPAAFVSIGLFAEPIGSTILAFIILSEIPGTFEAFGAILILMGIYIASVNQADFKQ